MTRDVAPAPAVAGPSSAAHASNFLMPAEWDSHAATWLAWPHNRSDWPGRYAPIPFVYAEIIRHLACHEHVHLIVNDAAWEQKARAVLARTHVPLDNVSFHRWPTDRGWLRDSGPIFVYAADGQQIALHWRFNAWAKYPDWKLDAKLPTRIARYLGVSIVAPAPAIALAPSTASADPSSAARSRNSLFASRYTLEGGAIDVNGRGTLLATEECLLSTNIQCRNPGISRKQLEEAFARYVGARRVIWLGRGIAGDDTHGHVDDIARFVAPDTVVAAVEPNADDPNHQPLAENLGRLRRATDQDGRPLRVVGLPMPAPILYRGQRLPASYANFYIANGVVLVPTFNDPNDRVALNTLAGLFPEREIVPIYSGDLIWGLGAVHCMTQQQPA